MPLPVRLIAALLLLLIMAPACSQPPPSDDPPPAADIPPPISTDPNAPFFTPEPLPQFAFEGGVRIAVLNTEFMFDGMGDEGQATFPHKDDPAAARAHRDRIGEILRWLDADLVMLEEVEHDQMMQKLVDESLADMGYQVHFVQGTDRFTGQDVGLLSRLPVEDVGRTDERAPVGASGDTYGVSKNMYARLDLGGIPTTIIGVHFLARPSDASRKEQREAQAEVIRRLVAQETGAGRAVVVLGDFNDYDDATLDVSGSQPITNVLATIKSAGPGADDDLQNVMADVPQFERFTVLWDQNDNRIVESGELTAIDHLLLSPTLYTRVREVVYVQAHDPLVYTDHFPIVVGLDVN